MSKKRLFLYRYSGTGNKFVLFDLRDVEQKILFKKYFNKLSRPAIARRLCKRFRDTAGDGLVLLEKSKKADLAWDFYNADGTHAEMCGNAARCVGLHLSKGKKTKRPYKLKTKSGIVDISVYNGQNIHVKMSPIRNFKGRQKLSFRSTDLVYDTANTGVPHVMLQLETWKLDFKTSSIARYMQKHSRFKPKSTNVTFWKHRRLKTIRAASYERGVPGYTLACGTGAVAAAISFVKRYQVKEPLITVLMPGGRLKVDLTKKRPILIGPAKRFAKIEL